LQDYLQKEHHYFYSKWYCDGHFGDVQFGDDEVTTPTSTVTTPISVSTPPIANNSDYSRHHQSDQQIPQHHEPIHIQPNTLQLHTLDQQHHTNLHHSLPHLQLLPQLDPHQNILDQLKGEQDQLHFELQQHVPQEFELQELILNSNDFLIDQLIQ